MSQPIRQQIKENFNPPLKDIYTLLIDGNNLFKIASSGDKRVNGRGEHVGGIFQFLLQIKIMLHKKNFDQIYVFWDEDNSGELRWQLYEDYKANRDKQYGEYNKQINNYIKNALSHSNVKQSQDEEDFIREKNILREYLEELFIRQISAPKVEADDLLSYYCKNKKENEYIVIISSDKDLTQLISEKIIIYSPNKKGFINTKNHIKEAGYTHKNVLLKKIFCGDSSDNIKGIKGLGEKTFFDLFPEAIENELQINDIIEKAKVVNEERIKNKQKPLKVCNNIIDSITDGCQGKDIYKINKKIIDLSNPLMTKESIEMMNDNMYAPIDPDGRSLSNLYKLIVRDDIIDLKEDRNFTNFFIPFNKLIEKEKRYYIKNE